MEEKKIFLKETDKDVDMLLYQALSKMVTFVGICDTSKQRFRCLHYAGEILDLEEWECWEDFEKKLSQRIFREDFSKFLEAFDDHTLLRDGHVERTLRFFTKTKEIKYYELSISLVNLSDGMYHMILVKKVDEIEKRNVHDVLSRMAFSKVYVLIGVRDQNRQIYENIYCADDLFVLPDRCEFEEFRKQIDNALYPKDRAEYFRTIRNCEHSQKTTAEFRMYDLNHVLHYYQGLTFLLDTFDGPMYVFMLRNIDAQKQQEKAHKLQEEKQRRLSDILANIGGIYYGVIAVDAKSGKYTMFLPNQQENNIQDGREYDKRMEKNIKKFVHPEDQDMLYKAMTIESLKMKLLNNDHVEIEYRRRLKQDGYGWVRVIAKAIRKDETSVQEFLIGFLDITDNRVKELAARARERRLCDIIEVQNERLQNTVEQVNVANDAKTRFLSTLVHELRVPINAIVGLTRLALEQTNNQIYIADSLDKIMNAAENMSNLMNNVIDIKTIESGKIRLHYHTYSIRRMVDRICGMIKISCQEKGHHLTVNSSSIKNDIVEMDELRTMQVLLNILTNAVQFTNPGGNISFLVKEIPSILAENSSKYCFTIEDDGIGIAKEQLDHIFDPFVNTENINGETGSGIGLYVAKNIVSLMDGQIYIKSNVNQGTIVIVTLVLEKGNILAIPEKIKRNLHPFPGKRVLVVEDQAISLSIVTHLLQTWKIGYQVASNGQEALNILHDQANLPFDCILMDVHLPIMKGDQVTKEIRKSKNMKICNIPIIAMTADAMEEDITYVISIGMNDHVAKPIFPEALHNCLQKWF